MDQSQTPSPPEPHPAAASPAVPSSGGPAAMRASDADRDRIADRLREALAEGRLTPDEHSDRIDAVYRARTYAELAPIVADLPAEGDTSANGGVRLDKEPPLPEPRRESASVTAVFGGAERRGRWLVEAQTSVLSAFGGVDLDFRQAVLSAREVTLNITCVCGGVSLTVPPGVRVISSISAVFGGTSLPDDDPLDPDAPVIRLSGVAIFGGVDVKRKRLGSP
ncbi:DUF1707 SHOCT-like domain-containing protein [Thermomonospora umbrina]|uniref:Cell wall-active antibiotic response 4TMS protein YvqF n=1 Tax=Thermomonospora umbrina TaxID=111806 RepID=A0A3D9SV79_9ACTN|nr:DUF1707 domain-containing protein [Thermomonospora umbrina]REE99698.1 cell wall-active antibiotic response 4TMS protein YvqF [Thermomonospora umbrina]